MVKEPKDRRKKAIEKKLVIWFSCNYGSTLKLILLGCVMVLVMLSCVKNLPEFCGNRGAEKEEYKEQASRGRDGVVRRRFQAFGSAAYSFILMSAYRGGPQTFSIIGLSSKPLQVFGRPEYQCEYYRANNNTSRSIVTAHKILPDWGFGRVYTVVVLNCTFTTTHPSLSVADASAGGKLLLRSTTFINPIPALVEPPHSWDPFQFSSSPKYDYLYCGSPLYGDLSPQRMREWLAYHIRLFGKRSHFVIHDAGGIHSQLLSVFKPWIQLGYVTLHDVTQQERFDGYYHNQFLVLNDCLHRYRFHSNWIFFFDVDEYIYLPSYLSFASVMASFRNFTQFTFAQIPIANNLCLTQDAGITSKKWVMEKLVYRNVKKVARRDRKYAVQPRNVYATGVHLSKNFEGESIHKTEKLIKYFHYHGTIATRHDTCQHFLNDTSTTIEETPYVLDTNMRSIASLVKKFELDTIGSKLESTKQ